MLKVNGVCCYKSFIWNWHTKRGLVWQEPNTGFFWRRRLTRLGLLRMCKNAVMVVWNKKQAKPHMFGSFLCCSVNENSFLLFYCIYLLATISRGTSVIRQKVSFFSFFERWLFCAQKRLPVWKSSLRFFKKIHLSLFLLRVERYQTLLNLSLFLNSAQSSAKPWFHVANVGLLNWTSQKI